jgi:hypothetical protein
MEGGLRYVDMKGPGMFLLYFCVFICSLSLKERGPALYYNMN